MFSAADAYSRHVGRYGDVLASAHAAAANVVPGQSALDVGCGPGAFTAVLADILGPENVAAVDPSEPFAETCRQRVPGADVRVGTAENLPDLGTPFDVVSSQLVVNFMTDARVGVAAMSSKARPGGTVASVVWDYADGMKMLRAFWDAALALDPNAPDEGRGNGMVHARRPPGAMGHRRARVPSRRDGSSSRQRTRASTTTGIRSLAASARPARTVPHSIPSAKSDSETSASGDSTHRAGRSH